MYLAGPDGPVFFFAIYGHGNMSHTD